MNKLMSLVTWMVANYKKVIVVLITLLTAVAGILHFIPGNPGEKQVESAIQVLESIESK